MSLSQLEENMGKINDKGCVFNTVDTYFFASINVLKWFLYIFF